jgi:hypothetical protein
MAVASGTAIDLASGRFAPATLNRVVADRSDVVQLLKFCRVRLCILCPDHYYAKTRLPEFGIYCT